MKQDAILKKLNNIEEHFSQEEKPLTVAEACQFLNLSRSQIYRLTSQNQITFFKPGGKKIYFKKSDLNNWLFKNKSESK
jgi:excisionase family DNA binding protein